MLQDLIGFELSGSVVSGSSGAGAVVGPTVGPYFNVGKFRLRDFYSIIDFGAVQNGSTLDDAAWSEAMSYMPTIGGGVVWVPPSVTQTRISQPISIPNGVEVRGFKGNASVIGAAPGFSGAAMITNSDNSGNQEFAWVSDLKLAGGGNAPVGILFDTIYANSGIERVVTNQCTGKGIILKSSTVAQGPVYLRDVWSTNHGDDSVYIDATTGGMRGLWIDNLTAESPPAGFACLRYIASGGRGFSAHINGLHMETFIAGGIGLVLDGVIAVDARDVMGTASGSGSYTDLVQIKNACQGISLSKVFASNNLTGNLINDTTNGITIPRPSSGYISRYETDAALGSQYAVNGAVNAIPVSHSLLAWTHDPALNTFFGPLTAGKFYLAKIAVPQTISATNLLYYVKAAGATLTASQNFVGLLTSSGTLIATSADQTTNFGGTGLKTAALSGGPYTISGGAGVFVWAVFLSNGTTPPSFASAPGSTSNPDGFATNAGLTVSTARAATQGTGQTALASITPGSNSAFQILLWAGLS